MYEDIDGEIVSILEGLDSVFECDLERRISPRDYDSLVMDTYLGLMARHSTKQVLHERVLWLEQRGL